MFLDRFFQKREQTTVDENTVSDVLLRALLNGDSISRQDALTLPAVSGDVDFITSTIASMPIKLYKYTKGRVEEVTDDVRTDLLNGDTGDTLDGYQMKKAMVEDYLLGKGGYCFINRRLNEVLSLHYVKDEDISIMVNADPIYKSYEILVTGRTYRPHEFIKLLRNTKDGASGTGVCQEVSKALETAYNTLLYQLSLVKTGGNKKGFLKSQRKLGAEEVEALKTAWANLYKNNENNVVVLNNGLEFQEASNSSVEMQLNESKLTLQGEIDTIFHLNGDYETVFKTAIYPIVRAFETALNRDLLLEKEKKKYFFKFDVKEITRASLRERYEAYKIAKEIGLKTLNELRQDENLNALDGLNVVDFGLGSVLYDVDKKSYYTPNTGEQIDSTGGSVTPPPDVEEEIIVAPPVELEEGGNGP